MIERGADSDEVKKKRVAVLRAVSDDSRAFGCVLSSPFYQDRFLLDIRSERAGRRKG
jgi:hypothetical protein